MRKIKVRKCGIGCCPYCVHDRSNKEWYLCRAAGFDTRVKAGIKGFPRTCPLEEVVDE